MDYQHLNKSNVFTEIFQDCLLMFSYFSHYGTVKVPFSKKTHTFICNPWMLKYSDIALPLFWILMSNLNPSIIFSLHYIESRGALLPKMDKGIRLGVSSCDCNWQIGANVLMLLKCKDNIYSQSNYCILARAWVVINLYIKQ